MALGNICGFAPFEISIVSQDIHDERSGVSATGFAHWYFIRKDVREYSVKWLGEYAEMLELFDNITPEITIDEDDLPYFPLADSNNKFTRISRNLHLANGYWNSTQTFWEVSAVIQQQ
jgi:hypothetical protein